jgi:hypothetical protein
MISQITPEGRLGMAGADQHAAVACDQREDMAGGDDVRLLLGRIDRHRDRPRAIRRRDARRHAFERLDRHSERGLVPRAVVAAHQLESELFGPRLGQRETDQAATELRHEVDLLGRRHLRGDDQVALVLAVLVIDQDEHPAVARLVDDLFGARQISMLQAPEFGAAFSWH